MELIADELHGFRGRDAQLRVRTLRTLLQTPATTS